MARPAARGTIGGRNDNAVSPAAACCSSCHGRGADPGPHLSRPSSSAHRRALKRVRVPPAVTGPHGCATVSAASTSFGSALVVGAGRLRRLLPVPAHLRPAPFAVRVRTSHVATSPTSSGSPCDTVLWPALLTKGAPIAGPGVNPPPCSGPVTRTDLPGLPVGPAGDVRRSAVVPLLPGRGARAKRRAPTWTIR